MRIDHILSAFVEINDCLGYLLALVAPRDGPTKGTNNTIILPDVAG
jgi:hypothetical protein